ncbi:SEC7-like, alpha orthogonal bundle domain-containing protein [Rozella allomycis CSF55]|uniref:SEC7-like, alpha orthogonal bundle domain-containing protein n=1 Tax=Rozella allomycis (strain CSF55) TaxID=988480 RepID=A0A075B1N4_ROZAC|nr:SEC7-like, alpha orthogonal bundle domain-containing protein [Rozella allomycis CSF55]|eukprot:EPZ34698.1 SEC7-like, alpha orthogonal bundle domain-containing protein [Rozella allomycis CSF55]
MQWCLNKREGLDIGNNVSDVLVSPIDSDTIILDEQSSRKRLLKDLISEFNKSPIKTIQKFINNGFCLEDSKSVAEFILHEKSLSKKAIGELLGENDSFFIKVMHSFVDQLDFREMKFVTALRSFLQKFRLPGESQKIDRLMEKFAERYVACNPCVFSTADTAYTLAYSIIMLNTDQHSKQVKKKMDKSAFIKNNRGINNNKDLPDVFLEEIFNEISENEIVLEDERNIRRSSFILNQPISIKVTKQKGTPSEYQKAKSVDHVKYMFSSINKEMIACIEKEYETNGGFKYLEIYPACLNICSLFGLVLERDSIIESLKKLSTLKGKSTEAMKAIINLGNYFGNFLDANWAHVLETVATIESSNSIDDFNEFENQNLLVSIDRIFSHSVDLDGEAIIYFFTALIGTYKKIDESRLVSLRRVVEVCFFNTNRIRLEWNQIWKIVAPLFKELGSNLNERISIFAIDSLRQLSLKLLEKDELAHFHGQSSFLSIFEEIFKSNSLINIKELIIDSISQMIDSKSKNLKSGWVIVFRILSNAAQSKNLILIEKSFAVLKIIKQKYLSFVTCYSFDTLIQTVICFHLNETSEKISLESLNIFEFICTFCVQDNVDYSWETILFAFENILFKDGYTLANEKVSSLLNILNVLSVNFKLNDWDVFCDSFLKPAIGYLTELSSFGLLSLILQIFDNKYQHFPRNEFLYLFFEILKEAAIKNISPEFTVGCFSKFLKLKIDSDNSHIKSFIVHVLLHNKDIPITEGLLHQIAIDYQLLEFCHVELLEILHENYIHYYNMKNIECSKAAMLVIIAVVFSNLSNGAIVTQGFKTIIFHFQNNEPVLYDLSINILDKLSDINLRLYPTIPIPLLYESSVMLLSNSSPLKQTINKFSQFLKLQNNYQKVTCEHRGSNTRPSDLQSDALPTELCSLVI